MRFVEVITAQQATNTRSSAHRTHHRQAASVVQFDSVVKAAHCPQVGAVYSTVTVPQPMSTAYVQPNPDCQFHEHMDPRAAAD
jgi:hypothetical protein